MKNFDLGNQISTAIERAVDEYLSERSSYDYKDHFDNIYSDTLGELIDKLIITHIRYWMLEDQMGVMKDPTTVGELKLKADVLFKQKRPQLVASIDKVFLGLASKNIEYVASNPKIYRQE